MRVLIVEDDVNLAATLGWLVEGMGDESKVCHTGQEAIETSKVFGADVCLVDLALPDMDGVDLCHHLHADAGKPAAVVVAHSANSYHSRIREAKSAGCSEYFVKGLDFERLINFLKGWSKFLRGDAPSPLPCR